MLTVTIQVTVNSLLKSEDVGWGRVTNKKLKKAQADFNLTLGNFIFIGSKQGS